MCECIYTHVGFPGGSVSKESACSEGDLGLIPGSGRSPGEGMVDNPCGQRRLAGCRVGRDWATKHRACVLTRIHTHTHVQPNHFAIHPRLIHRKSTALQSQNKACICLTLKLYPLLYVVHENKMTAELSLPAPALSRDSCQCSAGHTRKMQTQLSLAWIPSGRGAATILGSQPTNLALTSVSHFTHASSWPQEENG